MGEIAAWFPYIQSEIKALLQYSAGNQVQDIYHALQERDLEKIDLYLMSRACCSRTIFHR